MVQLSGQFLPSLYVKSKVGEEGAEGNAARENSKRGISKIIDPVRYFLGIYKQPKDTNKQGWVSNLVLTRNVNLIDRTADSEHPATK